jgi:RHS repeat-associated protein
VKDPLNHTENYTYDTSHNRTNVQDKRGYHWAYTYDSKANVLTAKDPYLNTTTMTYNTRNKMLSLTIPTGEKTEYTYDTQDNVTEVKRKDSGGVLKSTETYTVNSNGQVTDYYDGLSRRTQYGYNSNGHLNSVTTPNSRVTTWIYNSLGLATARTDALSRTTNYTYDNWMRLTTVDYPAGTDPTFTYDVNNNMTQMVDANGTFTWVYDNADRPTSETFGGTTMASYAYDATGKKGLLSTVTDSNSRVLTYSYTDRQQLYQVSETAGTATYIYDANGNTTAITNYNGTTVTNTFDNASRLTSVVNKNSGGTTLSSFSYTLNANGERTAVTEADGSTVTWAYDWGRRLTSETRTGTNAVTKTYTLDVVGNRTSQVVAGVTTTFTLNNDDELTATSGGFVNSYAYNANGEQTTRTLSGTSHTLSYDYEGQLTSIMQGGNTTSFAYDALGRRHSRTAGGTTTRFQYAGQTILLEKQGTTTTATYSYGNGLLRKDSEYFQTDGLGSTRTITNGSQTVTGTANYDSFGMTLGTTGSSGSSYLFAGQSGYRTDGDAGLMHVRARYYDPQVGRFITRDTYLDQKPYLYCEHDPVNYVDPNGHEYSDWNPFTWDYRFNRDDWRQIADRINDFSNGEIKTGGAVLGINLPFKGIGIDPYTGNRPSDLVRDPYRGLRNQPGIIVPSRPASPGGIFAAVGGGILLGGCLAKGIAKIIRVVAD